MISKELREFFYHLPIGHVADCTFTFSFIKQPHSLHCFVDLINLGHSSQIENRRVASTSDD
jgi:hypothetical protein